MDSIISLLQPFRSTVHLHWTNSTGIPVFW